MHDTVRLSPKEQGEARYREMKKVTLIGSVIDLLLGVFKILVGWVASSQSLIADGVHSLSDLATDFVVLYAAKHGSREADEEHPYGHGRIETLATAGLGVALMIVAIGIAWDAVSRLFEPERLFQPGVWALVVALLSVVLKEWIYRYTMRVAKRVRSPMLEANAWHSRTDAISSIVVVIGVGGTMLGLDYLDAIAAVGVALMVAKIGWDLGWESLHELADRALEQERVEKIRKAILAVDGVRHLHLLRSRKVGHEAVVDVHVQVDPWLSVSEGHMIAIAVEEAAKSSLDEVTDVTVHIDPEDDEEAPPCEGLPLRGQALGMLERAWKEAGCNGRWERVQLHYIQGRVHVDLYLPLACLDEKRGGAESIRDQLAGPLAEMKEFGKLRIFFTA
ncbi:MAG: cation diffusion facilitator family transporter [Sedimenticolaceae bacterium]|nr:cation diffusion facilitator family transporter [Sedimenticolaceae bacterium]